MIPLWCSHPETTPTDDEGRTICLACGSVIQVRLTRELFDEAVSKMTADWLRSG